MMPRLDLTSTDLWNLTEALILPKPEGYEEGLQRARDAGVHPYEQDRYAKAYAEINRAFDKPVKLVEVERRGPFSVAA